MHGSGPGESIFTEADGIAVLHEQVYDAVRCHVDGETPTVGGLLFVRAVSPPFSAHTRRGLLQSRRQPA